MSEWLNVSGESTKGTLALRISSSPFRFEEKSFPLNKVRLMDEKGPKTGNISVLTHMFCPHSGREG
jgi:hypothetical protein